MTPENLASWLREQIDEDERVARATRQASLSWQNFDMDGELRDTANAGTVAYIPIPQTRDHIARHDPARVLDGVEAKGRLLEEILFGYAPEKLLRILAVEYADRPGYREEWKP